MSFTTILQVRTSSRRLPGKVLKPICGKPMLVQQIERIERADTVTRLIVATSDRSEDDEIVKICEQIETTCYRGPLDDVLSRFFGAASRWPASHIIRLTGDCPLIDPVLIDKIAKFHASNWFDYTSNTLDREWPKGLDVEVVRFDALKIAYDEAATDFDREHVMPFLWRQPERFKIGTYKEGANLSGKRWTVDYPEDLEMVRRVYESLYPTNPFFSTSQILDFLADNPDIEALNIQYGT